MTALGLSASAFMPQEPSPFWGIKNHQVLEIRCLTSRKKGVCFGKDVIF